MPPRVSNAIFNKGFFDNVLCKEIKYEVIFMFIVMSPAVVSAPGLAQTNATDGASIEANRAAAQQLLADGQPNAALRRIEQVIIAAPRDLSARFF